MKYLCHNLEQLINQNFDNSTFSDQLNPQIINQFEVENKLKLTEGLKQFFLWQNGIQIENKLQFLSLQEAFEFYQKETNEFSGDFLVNDSEFSSRAEAEIFRKEYEAFTKNKQKDFWLPIFIQTTTVQPTIHAIWLSEIKDQDSMWVKINSPDTPEPFDFKFLNQGNYTLNFYTDISALLSVSMGILNPQKTSFWTELKGTLGLFGKLFD